MKCRRGLAAGAIVGAIAGLVLPGATPAVAAGPTFTPRYSAQGWMDVVQIGAASVACPPDGPGCQDGSDPTVPTSWVDVDQDPSTMNSSRAVLAIPPKAAVDWVGLYWAGDRGGRDDGAPPRCDATTDSATPPTLPPAPDKANQVKLAVGDKPYAAITANSIATVTGPGGGTGFQAYQDITQLVRSAAATTGQVSLAVAELQVASGPGCGGGWTAVLAYSYPDGPDKTSAPDFRSLAVFDGALSAPAGVRQDVRLDGVPASKQDGPAPRLSSSWFASGQALGSNALTLGSASVPRAGNGVTGITGQPGPGYQLATSPVAAAAVKPGAALGITAQRSGFLTGVLALSTPLPVKVNLSVAAEVSPTSVPVGSEAALTVTVRNDADLKATGVKVTVTLPAGLKLAAEADNYDAGTGVWSAPPVVPHGSSALALQVLVQDPGDQVSTAQITGTDIANQNQAGENASVTVTAMPSAGPSASTPAQEVVVAGSAPVWPQLAPAVLFGVGLFLLGLFLLSLAVVRHRARAR